ncbi:MAG: ABC transporter ATP-binding protein [Ottowia sp.]|nr:ABC transporter ATP-binding protein [Ottowia sp.]
MPAISFQSVSKIFPPPQGSGQPPLRAVDDVSFDIEEGEFFGLLGPNGAGKTTLISILAGLARATHGRVRVHGFDVQDDFAQARRHLGIVPQELVFDPFFSVRELLRFQSGYFGIFNNDDWIDELLSSLDLTDKAADNTRKLSGGMKRRLLVAQALVHKPPVIVLDEPTAGVDVELRQTLWQFVKGLNQQGHTVVLTTHYLEEAEALCQRLAMLRNGRVIALDRTSALLAKATAHALRFKTDSALPPALAAKARVTGRIVELPAQDSAEIERLLRVLREAGVRVEDVEVRKADLEDVFIDLMHDRGAWALPPASAVQEAA